MKPACRILVPALLTVLGCCGSAVGDPGSYARAHCASNRIKRDSSADNVAFQKPDDGSFVLIAANSATSAKVLSVRCRDHEFRYTMPGESVATFVWSQPDALRYN
jgi:O-glycosyl hydrolase